MFKKFQKSVVEYWTFSLPALGAISYHRDGNGSSTCLKNTLWLFHIAMERSTIFQFGKPSISIRAMA